MVEQICRNRVNEQTVVSQDEMIELEAIDMSLPEE